jgi:hypothetical protein
MICGNSYKLPAYPLGSNICSLPTMVTFLCHIRVWGLAAMFLINVVFCWKCVTISRTFSENASNENVYILNTMDHTVSILSNQKYGNYITNQPAIWQLNQFCVSGK